MISEVQTLFQYVVGNMKMQILSVMSLSTKGGHPEVNECKKSKLKFLVS